MEILSVLRDNTLCCLFCLRYDAEISPRPGYCFLCSVMGRNGAVITFTVCVTSASFTPFVLW